jgi:hypothetical protein
LPSPLLTEKESGATLLNMVGFHKVTLFGTGSQALVWFLSFSTFNNQL